VGAATPPPTRDAAIRAAGATMPPLTRAAAIRAGAAMPPLTRAAAMPAAAAATTAADTAVRGAATILAGSTPAEAITTVEVSGLVRTLESGSASPSAGATIRVPVAATMTDTDIGSRLPAIRTSTRVTDRVAVCPRVPRPARGRPGCPRVSLFCPLPPPVRDWRIRGQSHPGGSPLQELRQLSRRQGHRFRKIGRAHV